MTNREPLPCPECEDGAVDRRHFLQTSSALVAGGVVTAAAPRLLAQGTSAAQAPAAARPAEALIKELYSTLSAEQKRAVRPFNDPAKGRTYNSAMRTALGTAYTQPQQELCQRILRAMTSGEEGYNKLSRNNTWDSSGSFARCGADFFGEAEDGKQWAWVFTGHHITLRCDGDSAPNVAFGGNIYYGHSAAGDSARNVFNYQTRSVKGVFDALNEAQRRQAVVNGRGVDREGGIVARPAGQAVPGIGIGDLTADQKALVETVLRDILSPFRREDGDEVMAIIRRNGGMDRLRLAFHRDAAAEGDARFSYWRVEGPNFIWNYRVLPHVHCYVTVASQA